VAFALRLHGNLGSAEAEALEEENRKLKSRWQSRSSTCLR
jgi:hypothetical protein